MSTTGCGSCGKPSEYARPEIMALDKSKPELEPNGGLLFKTVAPTVPGYVHDRENPKRLLPDFVPCTERITLPVLTNDGYWIMNRCNHIECPMRGKDVDEDICDSCDFRIVNEPPKPLEV